MLWLALAAVLGGFRSVQEVWSQCQVVFHESRCVHDALPSQVAPDLSLSNDAGPFLRGVHICWVFGKASLASDLSVKAVSPPLQQSQRCSEVYSFLLSKWGDCRVSFSPVSPSKQSRFRSCWFPIFQLSAVPVFIIQVESSFDFQRRVCALANKSRASCGEWFVFCHHGDFGILSPT